MSKLYEVPGTGLLVELGRGERVLFTNRQWAVTNKVIEELHPTGWGYWIGRWKDLATVGHFPLQHTPVSPRSRSAGSHPTSCAGQRPADRYLVIPARVVGG